MPSGTRTKEGQEREVAAAILHYPKFGIDVVWPQSNKKRAAKPPVRQRRGGRAMTTRLTNRPGTRGYFLKVAAAGTAAAALGAPRPAAAADKTITILHESS